MIEKDFMEMMQFKLGLQDEQSFNQVEKGGRDGQKQHCTNAESGECRYWEHGGPVLSGTEGCFCSGGEIR